MKRLSNYLQRILERTKEGSASQILDWKPLRNDEIVWRTTAMDSIVLILDMRSGIGEILSGIKAATWKCIDGRNTVRQVIEGASKEYSSVCDRHYLEVIKQWVEDRFIYLVEP